MNESLFTVPKMDCPSEERMIRLALDPIDGIEGIQFDLPARTVRVHHDGPVEEVLTRLEPLGFGARLEHTRAAGRPLEMADPADETQVLQTLLAINATMFAIELGFGFWAASTGLIADSLDMLADAFVYGISLYAVGRAASDQRRAAHASGWLQLALALGVLLEVVRRAFTGSEPVEVLMIGVSLVALAANLACVALLARHRDGGAHLQASWIFTTNDALVNLGVVVAGVLVLVTGSAVPDLLIGASVGVLVLSGALRILRL